jgi:glycine/D-amino acid oxidase-like deaminating enzyme/nitrite reductase/ring-hydroxylating ferredoxin subunit
MSTALTLPVWQTLEAETSAWFADRSSTSAHDVIVVGAGIAGLATALCLLRDGRRVTVIDKQGVGAGETLRTTAHLASALDDRYTRLQRQHGQDGARLAASSHAAAIDWIEALALGSGQDCGFKRVPGYLFAHDRDRQRLDEEAEAARQAGLAAQLCEAGQELPAELGPVIRFEAQARVDMGRFLLTLARAVHAAGGQFLRAEATAINGGQSPSVELRDGTVLTASAVVAAGNVPFHETGATYMKQAPYRSYVVVAEGPREAWPDALIWDDADPYHYVRLLDADADSDHVRLIVGGEDHKTGQDDDPQAYVRLQAWADRRFPGALRYTHAWSGQVLEPADGLAYIGRDPDNDNVYLVTGDSGNGITHGALAGLLIGDLIQGRDNPWRELYDPGRKPLRAGGEWLRENANAALQFRDWLKPGDISDPDQLTPGNGAVLRQGLHRVACYRSGDGQLHSFNARCPHLGCVVRWSSEEKSWDCPCHGSRFEAATGAILNGPTSEPLARFDWPRPD